jgi:hypothetical protein
VDAFKLRRVWSQNCNKTDRVPEASKGLGEVANVDRVASIAGEIDIKGEK